MQKTANFQPTGLFRTIKQLSRAHITVPEGLMLTSSKRASKKKWGVGTGEECVYQRQYVKKYIPFYEKVRVKKHGVSPTPSLPPKKKLLQRVSLIISNTNVTSAKVLAELEKGLHAAWMSGAAGCTFSRFDKFNLPGESSLVAWYTRANLPRPISLQIE